MGIIPDLVGNFGGRGTARVLCRHVLSNRNDRRCQGNPSSAGHYDETLVEPDQSFGRGHGRVEERRDDRKQQIGAVHNRHMRGAGEHGEL